MALNISVPSPQPVDVVDYMNKISQLREQQAQAKYADPRLKAALLQAQLANQKSQTLLPFVAPHEQATIQDLLAGASLKGQEARFVPTKYAQAAEALGIKKGQLDLSRKKNSPQQLQAKLNYLNSMAQMMGRNLEQTSASGATDFYGNPVPSPGSPQGYQPLASGIAPTPDQKMAESLTGMPSTMPSTGQQMVSQLAQTAVPYRQTAPSPQGIGGVPGQPTMEQNLMVKFPPLNDKEKIKQWISDPNTTDDQRKKFIDLIRQNNELKNPPSWKGETFTPDIKSGMTNKAWNRRIGSKGGSQVLMPPKTWSELNSQYLAIKSAVPDLEELSKIGSKLYLGYPLSTNPVEAREIMDRYNKQIALLKDKFVGATKLPKVRETFRTLEAVLKRAKGTRSKYYAHYIDSLVYKLKTQMSEIEPSLSSRYEYFPPPGKNR